MAAVTDVLSLTLAHLTALHEHFENPEHWPDLYADFGTLGLRNTVKQLRAAAHFMRHASDSERGNLMLKLAALAEEIHAMGDEIEIDEAEDMINRMVGA